MRAVVAGGNGFIGRALVASLAADDWEVVVLSRRPARVDGLPEGARAVEWDGASPGEWTVELDGAAAVVHLAGANIAGGRWTKARKRLLWSSRVDSSRAVADAVVAASSPPPVFVQSSGVGIYGDRGDEPLDEASPPGEGFLADLAVAWEAASAHVESAGVRRVCVRTSLALDASGGVLPVMSLPFRLFVGGPVGSGRQWVPWIHLADEVGAIRRLVEDESASGPFNFAAPGEVTNRQLSRALASALGRPCWLPVPAVALRLLLGEMSSLVLDSQRATPAALERLGYRFRFPELEAGLADAVG